MSATETQTPTAKLGPKRLSAFERYLTVWVGLCMVVGVLLGRTLPSLTESLRGLEFGAGSQINAPIAVLIWLMIVPMMMKIDFSSLTALPRRSRGLMVTLFMNWIVNPLSMLAVSWFFLRVVFLPILGEDLASQYLAGLIILSAAPCTAMVFVWSHLTDGDPVYTLMQVAINDVLLLILFAPTVGLLLGVSGIVVPMGVLITAVAAFIVVPLCLGVVARYSAIELRGRPWLEGVLLPRLQPLAVLGLMATLVCIFAFQADNILAHPFHVVLIAVPILVQVYFNSSLAYALMWLLKVPHSVAAPGTMIGASNFFELAVATAIVLYGPESGAALATVVGVLVEVPVMLSVCSACNRTQGWFDRL